MSKYTLGPFLKMVEQDVYENGCQPDTGFSHPVDVTFTGDSAEDVIRQAVEFFTWGDDDDAALLDACEEPGRVDIQVMENDDGHPPDERELKAWKRGDLRLWLADYSGYVDRCERVSLTTAASGGLPEE